MAITIPQSARQAACNAIVDLLDAGAGAGTLEIRTGSAPDPDVAATGTLLGTVTYQDPAFGNADTDGIATANTPLTDDTSADATGIAGYFRAEDSDGNCVFQGTVGTSGADLNLNPVSIEPGDNIEVSSQTFTVPQNQT